MPSTARSHGEETFSAIAARAPLTVSCMRLHASRVQPSNQLTFCIGLYRAQATWEPRAWSRRVWYVFVAGPAGYQTCRGTGERLDR